jgi:hypothetical protein
MLIPLGPPGSPAEDFPTLYPTRLRAYGAAPPFDEVRGCPALYKAQYVTCSCGHDRDQHDPDPDTVCTVDGCECPGFRRSIERITEHGSPLEFGGAIHEALFHMEEHAVGPEEALRETWPAALGLDRWAEAIDMLNHYLNRGGPMSRYATLAVEVELFAELYVDDDFGPIWFGGIIDWLGVDTNLMQQLHLSDYKGLALDTPIPTPTGWQKMEELIVGDQVIGGDGRPCNVTATSEVHMNPCYRMTFDDGSSVVCDHEHRWVVSAGPTGGRRKQIEPVEMTTEEIAERGIFGPHGQRDVRIDTVALDLPDADLPIDPYVLGCWLGDGSSAAGVITKPYQPLFDEIRRRGYAIGPLHGNGGRTVYGLRTQLREANILGAKHAPATYLRASRRQRLDLLRGLMDTDGHWNPTRQRAVVNTTQPWLAELVRELVVSLGWKATTFDTTATAFGREWAAQQVWFTPTECPFLARVPDDFRPSQRTQTTRRLIKSLDRIETVPTRCIAVDSLDHRYLCTEHMVPTHNTNQRPLSRDDVAVDSQLRGYEWLVHRNWKGRLGMPGAPSVIAHMDALRWNDVEVQFSNSDREEWQSWAIAAARSILRDTTAREVISEGCRWCPRKLQCGAYGRLPGDSKAILARAAGKSAEELWGWRRDAAAAVALLKTGIDDIDQILRSKARQEGSFVVDDQVWSEEDDEKDRVDLERLHRIIGDVLFYDSVSVTKKTLDQLRKAHPDLATEIDACVDRIVVGRSVTRKKVKAE